MTRDLDPALWSAEDRRILSVLAKSFSRTSSDERDALDRLLLAAAFDRAAVAITGQPAAELTAQLQPATASIGPADTAIIDRALDYWLKHGSFAPQDDIARIRALLCGPAPGGGS